MCVWPLKIWHFKYSVNIYSYINLNIFVCKNTISELPLSSFFKGSPGALPIIWKVVFIHMQMEANFHMKRWALGLILKRRPKVIQKWPIGQWNLSLSYSIVLKLYVTELDNESITIWQHSVNTPCKSNLLYINELA